MKDLDDAIAKANASVYGLGSSIWTRNLLSANKAIDKLQAGNVWVNSLHYGYDELPFGGVKDSGFGRFGGSAALEDVPGLAVLAVYAPFALAVGILLFSEFDSTSGRILVAHNRARRSAQSSHGGPSE